MRNRAFAPHINAGEEEEPDNVDEMPVPRRRLETEMAGGGELAGHGAEQAHGQEDGSDDDMEAVEAGRHEEGRAVNGLKIAGARRQRRMGGAFGEGLRRQMIEAEGEGRMDILIGLDAGEAEAAK